MGLYKVIRGKENMKCYETGQFVLFLDEKMWNFKSFIGAGVNPLLQLRTSRKLSTSLSSVTGPDLHCIHCLNPIRWQ